MTSSAQRNRELLVVIPVFNEEEAIRKVILEWHEELRRHTQDFLILVINDGSKDGTKQSLDRLQTELGDSLEVIHRENRGHGQTCLQGYQIAAERGIPFVFQVDSDGQCDPAFFESCWSKRNDYDVIYGKRVRRDDGWRRTVASSILKTAVWLRSGAVCEDANTPYRLMRTEKLRPFLPYIPNNFFLGNVALAVLLKKHSDFRHAIVPIRFRKRYGGQPKVRLGQFGPRAAELVRQLGEMENARQQSTAQSGSEVKKKVSEYGAIALVALVAAFLTINLITGTRSPTVWQDEVLYSDPAANLAFGHGFTSSAWPGQHYGDFWAGNVPMHQFLLAGWFKIFGFSLLSARSMNYVLISAAICCIWIACRRWGLLRTNAFSLVAALVILCGTGLTMSYRSARPDCLAILLASIAFLAFTIASTTTRRAALLGLGLLFPASGLQLAVFAAVFALFVMVWTRGKHFTDFLALGCGIFLGVVALAGFYSSLGVMGNFIAGVTKYADVGGRNLTRWERLRDVSHYLMGDKTQTVLALIAIASVLVINRGKSQSRLLLFGLGAWLFVSFTMTALIKYPVYYTWMAGIPLIICLFAALENAREDGTARRWSGYAVFAALLISALGLPLKLTCTLLRWPSRDQQLVENYVRPYANHGGWILTDFTAYFAVKNATNNVVLKTYLPTASDEEKSRIKIAIVPPDNGEQLATSFGGQWQPLASPLISEWKAVHDPNPVISKFARRLTSHPQDADWRLGVFEQQPVALSEHKVNN